MCFCVCGVACCHKIRSVNQQHRLQRRARYMALLRAFARAKGKRAKGTRAKGTCEEIARARAQAQARTGGSGGYGRAQVKLRPQLHRSLSGRSGRVRRQPCGTCPRRRRREIKHRKWRRCGGGSAVQGCSPPPQIYGIRHAHRKCAIWHQHCCHVCRGDLASVPNKMRCILLRGEGDLVRLLRSAPA